MEAIEIRGLTFSYPGQAEPALRGVNAVVHTGEFVTLCGLSGSGKTTLLRQLKPALAPHGVRTGEILFEGKSLDTLGLREQSAKIGLVQQSPENQLVTDKVWHELAFGLESLGYDTPVIRGRVAEMAAFFGIEDWFYRDVTALSGGQKQLLNLASVMVLQPSVLLLDEPTSQLDPIAAGDFLTAVGKINRELGTTILITEQRLEEVFPLSDQVLVLNGGCVIADGTPREVGGQLRAAGHPLFFAMPTAMRVWAAVPNDAACPITVRDGRDWLGTFASEQTLTEIPANQPPQSSGNAAISLSEVWFRYEKDQPDVLKGLSLTVRKGEFFALLGGNGTGKTTALSVIAGLQSPYRGNARVRGTVGVLPQDPQALFVKKTVREELLDVLYGKQPAEVEAGVARAAALCRLEGLLDRHPYDLSGGEQQRAALAEILLRDPDILLLDEPTKGLDAQFKQQLAALLQTLCRRGVTVFMVSHDVEFCAEYAHRCALFFDGSIVTDGPPRRFFSGNSFYTTAANHMARDLLPTAITAYDLIVACGGAVPTPPETPVETAPPSADNKTNVLPKKLPRWRKWISVAAGAAAVWAFIKAISVTDLTSLVDSSGVTGPIGDY
ncbi:MAG: ATP-binding cassette domain-containing protein, partial [Oscillospiraceae bacterium]|nr:ATP-binding cassette domain-containing protein [Oscillospiraceae bacterium]